MFWIKLQTGDIKSSSRVDTVAMTTEQRLVTTRVTVYTELSSFREQVGGSEHFTARATTRDTATHTCNHKGCRTARANGMIVYIRVWRVSTFQNTTDVFMEHMLCEIRVGKCSMSIG